MTRFISLKIIKLNYLDFTASDIKLIQTSMRMFEDQVRVTNGSDCIQFVQRTTETSYVNIAQGNGCNSFVGKQMAAYQPQTLNLGTGCVVFSVIAHELMHALGLFVSFFFFSIRNDFIRKHFACFILFRRL